MLHLTFIKLLCSYKKKQCFEYLDSYTSIKSKHYKFQARVSIALLFEA